MSLHQSAHRDFSSAKLFNGSARTAMACVEVTDMLCFKSELSLPYAGAAVFNCLRDLGCLVDWWPNARALTPFPPGLCNVGDMAVLNIRGESVLLRVLCFKPGKRILLALGLRQAPVFLELFVSQPLALGCTVMLKLETPITHSQFASAKSWLWLRLLGARASAGLDRHLRVSPRMENVAVLTSHAAST
jgi:hypothetical protein